MKTIKKGLLLFLLLLLTGCYPSDSTIQKGVDLLEAGKGEEGVTYFLNLNDEYELPLTEYFLGYAYYRDNQYAMALPLLESSLTRKSLKSRYIGDKRFSEFLAFNSNGVDDKLFNAALQELDTYRRSVGLSEKDLEILSSRAFFYFKQEDYEGAIELFRETVELATTPEEKTSSLFMISYIYEERLHDYAKADEALEEVLKFGPNGSVASKRAGIYMKILEQHVKKGNLLLKYLKNLGRLKKGENDILLAKDEVREIINESGIIFDKLIAVNSKENDRSENAGFLALRTAFEDLKREYAVVMETS